MFNALQKLSFNTKYMRDTISSFYGVDKESPQVNQIIDAMNSLPLENPVSYKDLRDVLSTVCEDEDELLAAIYPKTARLMKYMKEKRKDGQNK